MHAPFAPRHDQLLEALCALRDPQQRLAWVIDRARRRDPFPSEWRTPERLVPGCAARLWLQAWTERADSVVVCRFAVDSDSAILKAFAALLCDLYDRLPATAVVSGEPEVLERAGLLVQLTENRQRTVRRVRAVIRDFAATAAAAPPAP